MSKKLGDAEKIRAMLKYFRQSQTDFAKSLGYSQSALAHWITRDKLPYAVMDVIAEKYPAIAFSWLVTGLGPMLVHDGGRTMEQMSQNDKLAVNSSTFIPGLDCDEFIQCQGFALEPQIKQGDYIAVKTIKETDVIDPERIYLVYLTDGSIMLRYIKYFPDNLMYELSGGANKALLVVESTKIQSIRKVMFAGRMIY